MMDYFRRNRARPAPMRSILEERPEEDLEGGGWTTARIAGLGVAALLVVSGGAGAAWHFMAPGGDADVMAVAGVPDAETVEADAAASAEIVAPVAQVTQPAVTVAPVAVATATVAQAPAVEPEAAEVLPSNDPRWGAPARHDSPAAKALASVVKASATADAAPEPAMPDTVAAYATPTPRPDAQPAPAPTQEMTAAIEPDREAKPQIEAMPVEEKAQAAAIPAAKRSDRVNDAVNMRSGPDKDAGVVTVLPRGANVGVVECDSWCQVIYDGKVGYVYKSYIGRSSAAAAPATRKAEPEPQKEAPREAVKPTTPASMVDLTAGR